MWTQTRCKHELPARRRGFTLTEMAIVLGVIGLILGAIWTAASTAYSNQKVGKASNQVLAIAASIRSLFDNKPVFSSDLQGTEITPALVTAGIYPSDMQIETVTDPNHGTAQRPMNPWGGYVSTYVGVAPAGAAVSPASTFRISYYGLTSQECLGLMMAVAGGNPDSAGPIGVGSWYTSAPSQSSPNGNAYGADNYVALTPGTPFTPTTAFGICGSGTAGNLSAEFDFNL